ncbi:hypothetical protein [Labilibacter marinus]|uniref:hypothetical protein n=1 Tax=Labilibacter marinus TaxID=1477105 RepID=UPI00082F9419|nr:hypothetical protein [Labilibacter marinus]
MNKLNKEEQLELLWKKFNVFYSFFKDDNANSVALEAFRRMAHGYFSAKKLRELDQITAEFNGFCRELSKEDRVVLNKKIKDEIGIDLDEEKRLEKINRVLKRGKIINTKEYDLILNRVEETFGDNDLNEYVDRLNNLLSGYS